MKKKVFISHDSNDASYSGEVEKILRGAGHEVVVHRRSGMAPTPDSQLGKTLSAQVRSCDHVLVLTGNNTHNRPWVDFETHVAKSAQIPTDWVRLNNRTGAPPKELSQQDPIPLTGHDILSKLR